MNTRTFRASARCMLVVFSKIRSDSLVVNRERPTACSFRRYICLLVYIVLLPHLSFCFTFFLLIYSPSYLSFENRSALFPGRICRKRRLNLALVFFVFILCCNTFLLIGEHVLLLCQVQFFSIPSQEIGLWKRLRNDLFCVQWDVKPQLNQSI